MSLNDKAGENLVKVYKVAEELDLVENPTVLTLIAYNFDHVFQQPEPDKGLINWIEDKVSEQLKAGDPP